MNLGPTELLVVLGIFILLFGARKLPDLGSSVGKSIKNFRSGLKEGKEDEAEEPRVDVPTSTPSANGVRVD